MIRAFVDGVGLRAPGLAGWDASREVLAGRRAYERAEIELPACNLLPAGERRRAVPAVRLALAVGAEAVAHSGCEAAALAMVFASAVGDPSTMHGILEALASPEREVSPTRFQNSVYNAPAGYWSIATLSHQPSVSLSGFDATAGAGLVEAAVRVKAERAKVGLVVYDLPLCAPLCALRSIRWPFAAALILGAEPGDHTLATVDIDLQADAGAPCRLDDPELEALRQGTPTARILPLLAALASTVERRVVLEHTGRARLVIQVCPEQTAK